MQRREFVILLGAAAAWPLSGRAQQLTSRMRRIAVLDSAGREDEPNVESFRKRLDELGWHEGRNIEIEIRLADGNSGRAHNYADDLIATNPDIFLATNTQMVELIRAGSSKTPIVFVFVPDPIGSGLISSFAHPGRNITGFTNFEPSVGGKWLEILKDVVPGFNRVAVLLDAANPTQPEYERAIEAAASPLAVQVNPASLKDFAGIEQLVQTAAREPGGGLVVAPNALAVTYRDRIIALTAQNRLPTIYPYSEFAAAGGLMSYGFSRATLYQQAAGYVDRILKGEHPNDLPVQSPTKFELVVNLKTARSLGLVIPKPVLLIADEVIE
jgi:putative tryptophan/tyrosine transport system substrate-binding protein